MSLNQFNKFENNKKIISIIIIYEKWYKKIKPYARAYETNEY
jgi:hypothetical protein